MGVNVLGTVSDLDLLQEKTEETEGGVLMFVHLLRSLRCLLENDPAWLFFC